MRKHKFIATTIFLGTSIVPVHGSEKNKDVQYEVVKAKNYKGEEISQTLNRLEYVEFTRTKRLENEAKEEHLRRDVLRFNHNLITALKKYENNNVYTLDRTIKSSRKVYLN